MRLIDRDALEVVTAKIPKGMDAKSYMAGMEYVLGQIDATPTIEERKTGKWEHMGGDEWCCNQCGNVISTEGAWDHPLSDEHKMYHCNICGAKMVQEGEDNGTVD